jgi:GTPase SAR1 family protein
MEVDQNKNNYDLQLKIIIVGDSSVGKSSILNYYLKNTCK